MRKDLLCHSVPCGFVFFSEICFSSEDQLVKRRSGCVFPKIFAVCNVVILPRFFVKVIVNDVFDALAGKTRGSFVPAVWQYQGLAEAEIIQICLIRVEKIEIVSCRIEGRVKL